MNRRAFLGGLMGAGVAAGAVATAAAPNEPLWSGWRDAPTQIVRYGFWSILRADGWWVSSTLGRVDVVRDPLMVLDLSRDPGWPIITPHSSPDECEVVKARAKAALMAAIT